MIVQIQTIMKMILILFIKLYPHLHRLRWMRSKITQIFKIIIFLNVCLSRHTIQFNEEEVSTLKTSDDDHPKSTGMGGIQRILSVIITQIFQFQKTKVDLGERTTNWTFPLKIMKKVGLIILFLARLIRKLTRMKTIIAIIITTIMRILKVWTNLRIRQ